MYKILEKNQNGDKWQLRIAISNEESAFFNFENEPTQEEIDKACDAYIQSKIPVISTVEVKNEGKSQQLRQAENNYILFMRSLGLPDKASREDIQILCDSLEKQGKVLDGIKIAVQSLALINDITQNGGSWLGIEWNDII